MKVAIFGLLLALGVQSLLWHTTYVREQASNTQSAKKYSDSLDRLETLKQALQSSTDGEAKLVEDNAQLRDAYAALLADRTKLAKSAIQLADAYDKYSALTDADKKQDAALISSLQAHLNVASASRPIFVPVAPPPGPAKPTFTTGTIMHPDGSTTEIFLDTQQ